MTCKCRALIADEKTKPSALLFSRLRIAALGHVLHPDSVLRVQFPVHRMAKKSTYSANFVLFQSAWRTGNARDSVHARTSPPGAFEPFYSSNHTIVHEYTMRTKSIDV